MRCQGALNAAFDLVLSTTGPTSGGLRGGNCKEKGYIVRRHIFMSGEKLENQKSNLEGIQQKHEGYVNSIRKLKRNVDVVKCL